MPTCRARVRRLWWRVVRGAAGGTIKLAVPLSAFGGTQFPTCRAHVRRLWCWVVRGAAAGERRGGGATGGGRGAWVGVTGGGVEGNPVDERHRHNEKQEIMAKHRDGAIHRKTILAMTRTVDRGFVP